MREVIYEKPVSDPHVKEILQRIANRSGHDIRVSSGDRIGRVVRGSSSRSLHGIGQAADLEIKGWGDRQGFEYLRKEMNNIFDVNETYEVIYHGIYTETNTEHIHIGHYPAARGKPKGTIYFKIEGETPATKGKYATTPVKITNRNGATVPPELVSGVTVDARIYSAPLGIVQSVGKGGSNIPSDVTLVQSLINQSLPRLEESRIHFQRFNPLIEDGDCGRFTREAIFIFQRDVLNFREPDGLVEPGGKTIQALYITAYSSADKIPILIKQIAQSANGRGSQKGKRESYAAAGQIVDEPKIRAMLDTIIFAEGTGKYGAGTICYGTVIGFVKPPRDPGWNSWIGKDTRTFSVPDLSRHPYVRVRVRPGLTSTAAGKYQFMDFTWDTLAGVPDFTERNQDIAAVMLMQRRRMVEPILNGDVAAAVHRGAPEWASFPKADGTGYYPGQKPKPLPTLLEVYRQALSRSPALTTR